MVNIKYRRNRSKFINNIPTRKKAQEDFTKTHVQQTDVQVRQEAELLNLEEALAAQQKQLIERQLNEAEARLLLIDESLFF